MSKMRAAKITNAGKKASRKGEAPPEPHPDRAREAGQQGEAPEAAPPFLTAFEEPA